MGNSIDVTVEFISGLWSFLSWLESGPGLVKSWFGSDPSPGRVLVWSFTGPGPGLVLV